MRRAPAPAFTWRTVRRSRGFAGLSAAALLAAALSAVSLAAFPALPLQEDSLGYAAQAGCLRGAPGVTADGFAAPGYPLLLAGVRAAAGPGLAGALLGVQHVLHLAPLIFFAALAAIEPRAVAPGAAAVAWALLPESWVFAHYVMSETLGLALASLAAAALLASRGDAAGRAELLAGSASGALVLTRPGFAGWIVVGAWPRAGTRAPRWRFLAAAAFAAGTFRVGAAPCAGGWSGVSTLGRHLWNRVVAEGGLARPGDPVVDRLARGGRPPYWWDAWPALRRAGLDEAAADRALLRAAGRAVAAAPLAYLGGCLEGMADEAVWRSVPPPEAGPYRVLEHSLPVPAVPEAAAALWRARIPDRGRLAALVTDLAPVFPPRAATAPLAAWAAAWTALMAGPARTVVLLLAVAAAASCTFGAGRPSWGRSAVLLLAAGLAGHAAVEMAVPRYGIPLEPLTAALVASGAGRAVARLRRRR